MYLQIKLFSQPPNLIGKSFNEFLVQYFIIETCHIDIFQTHPVIEIKLGFCRMNTIFINFFSAFWFQAALKSWEMRAMVTAMIPETLEIYDVRQL